MLNRYFLTLRVRCVNHTLVSGVQKPRHLSTNAVGETVTKDLFDVLSGLCPDRESHAVRHRSAFNREVKNIFPDRQTCGLQVTGTNGRSLDHFYRLP